MAVAVAMSFDAKILLCADAKSCLSDRTYNQRE
jgi:hypothetical protein